MEATQKWTPKEPKKYQCVFCIEIDGIVGAKYDSFYHDEDFYKGNIFPTREEAENEDEWREIDFRLRQAIKEVNGEWKPNCSQLLWALYFDTKAQKVFGHQVYGICYTPMAYILSSARLAAKVIEMIGEEDLIKWFTLRQ